MGYENGMEFILMRCRNCKSAMVYSGEWSCVETFAVVGIKKDKADAVDM